MAKTATGNTLPTKTSDRMRPNKAFIEKTAEVRGFMTGNEKTFLATLTVKNAMQRVNNRAMSDNVNNNFNGGQNEALQNLIKEFVRNVDAIVSI